MRNHQARTWLPVLATCLIATACANEPDTQAESPPTPDRQADAQAGVPFDLYTHCGVNFATFDGRTWKTTQPVPDTAGTPFARGAVDHLSGTAVLVEDDTLRFTVADDSAVIPGQVVTFELTTETAPLCH
jgi:hypothetical protein